MKEIIENAWDNRELLKEEKTRKCIEDIIEELDNGKLRVAEPSGDDWIVNEWIKKAVILYFPIRQMETTTVGPMEFHDKMKLKGNYASLGVRVVPHGIARYGSFLAKTLS
jgi:2,3,4,5-tetrahydropyridine-2-carboxylate N-succinyltransferase